MTRPDDQHWVCQRERGNLLGLRLTAWAVRVLGRPLVAPIVWVAALYFYATGVSARRAIAHYQRRLTQTTGRPDLFPRTGAVYRQFLAFGGAMLDSFDVWRGVMPQANLVLNDPDHLVEQMGRGHGQILVGSHLGNMELCRALAGAHAPLVLNVLVHDKHAPAFNRLLGQAREGSRVKLIQVTELDMGVMMTLAACLARGEWIAIVGDRVPVHGDRTVAVDFLGAQASLPQGPWLLAALLRCPVNALFCVRQGERHEVSLSRLADQVPHERRQRDLAIQACAQRYADRLSRECERAPLQWFNFFEFWHAPSASATTIEPEVRS